MVSKYGIILPYKTKVLNLLLEVNTWSERERGVKWLVHINMFIQVASILNVHQMYRHTQTCLNHNVNTKRMGEYGRNKNIIGKSIYWYFWWILSSSYQIAMLEKMSSFLKVKKVLILSYFIVQPNLPPGHWDTSHLHHCLSLAPLVFCDYWSHCNDISEGNKSWL